MWQDFRNQLRDFEFASGIDPVWKGAFALCGEVPSAAELVKFKVSNMPQIFKDKIRKGWRRWRTTASQPLHTVSAETLTKLKALVKADGPDVPVLVTDKVVDDTAIVADAPPQAVGAATGDGCLDFKDEAVLAVCWSCGCSKNTLEGMPVVRRASMAHVVDSMEPDELSTLVEVWRHRLVNPTEKSGPGSLVHLHGKSGKRSYTSSRLPVRIACGKACQKYLATPEGMAAKSKNVHWSALSKHLAMLAEGQTANQRKKTKQWLKRCVADAEQSSKGQQLIGETSRKKSAPPWLVTPERLRYRKRGLQGRPLKMGELSHATYQWFVDVRGIARSRLRPRVVMAQVQIIQQRLVAEMIELGLRPDPAVIDRKWLIAFCFRWGVSLKCPNKRYKVKRHVLKSRLCVYWSNTYAIRLYFWILYGIDVLHEQYDQTGMHLNEAGSKNMRTLTITDIEEVALLECHMQTRSRISWVTCCFSNRKKAGRKEPLEVMLKAKTNQVLGKLALPANTTRYSLQVGPKGSYREEHMLTFLERHLPKWTPERAAQNDYRILGLDAYAPHKSARLVKFAWSRGYIAGEGSMIPAGATGVVAGPDTDVHGCIHVYMQEAT